MKWCPWDSSFIQNNPKQTSINQKQEKIPKYNLFSLKAGSLLIFISFFNLSPKLSIGSMLYFYEQNVLKKQKPARWYMLISAKWGMIFGITVSFSWNENRLVPYFCGDAKFFWRDFDEWKPTNESDKPSLIWQTGLFLRPNFKNSPSPNNVLCTLPHQH